MPRYTKKCAFNLHFGHTKWQRATCSVRWEWVKQVLLKVSDYCSPAFQPVFFVACQLGTLEVIGWQKASRYELFTICSVCIAANMPYNTWFRYTQHHMTLGRSRKVCFKSLMKRCFVPALKTQIPALMCDVS